MNIYIYMNLAITEQQNNNLEIVLKERKKKSLKIYQTTIELRNQNIKDLEKVLTNKKGSKLMKKWVKQISRNYFMIY